MIDNDNCGCTPPPVVGAKGHWEFAPIPDTCKPVELTDKLIKEMYEKNVNTEAFTTIEKAQLELLHNNVGGPNGAIKQIVAGDHVTVDSTDPTKPIISTDGVKGPKGPDGPIGPQGIQGVAGLQGPTGKDGISWHLAGRDTEANIMAKTGVPGDMWIVTEPTNTKDGHAFGWDALLVPAGWNDMGQFKGDKGDKGDTGSTGAAGSTGAKGPQGVTGTKGPKGVTGSQGPKGDTGAKGDTGGKGLQGGKGDKGDAGKNGTGVQVKGSKANVAAIKPVTGSVAGDMWIAQDTGNGWVSDGATPTVWTDAGKIQGPRGHTGSTGPQGNIGLTGPKGSDGPKGDTGNNGADGSDGVQGNPGSKGDTGPAGPKGSIGHKGTKGDSGPRGPTGGKGPQGSAGPQGLKGPKGNAGKDAVLDFATDTETRFGIVDDKATTPKSVKAGYVGVGGGSFTGLVRFNSKIHSNANIAVNYSPGGWGEIIGKNIQGDQWKIGNELAHGGSLLLKSYSASVILKAGNDKGIVVESTNSGWNEIVGISGGDSKWKIGMFSKGGKDIMVKSYEGNVSLLSEHGKVTANGKTVVTGSLSGTHLKLYL